MRHSCIVYSRIHNSSNYTFFVNGTAGGNSAWSNSSDRRLKENIETIPNALDKVNQMRGVTFDWKDGRKDGQEVGFIAQEIEDILPQVVDTTGEYRTMQYAPITAVLVEATKELSDKNDQLEKEKVALATKVEQLETKVEQLETQNQRISDLETLVKAMQQQMNSEQSTVSSKAVDSEQSVDEKK